MDRQRINRALTYFLYAQANRQIVHIPPGFLSLRNSDLGARRWVDNGLRQPDQIVVHSKAEAHIGFEPHIPVTIGIGGSLERWYGPNPKASRAEMFIQLFDDAPSRWDFARKIWHLPPEYAADYEWARNESRFKFFLAFYQDPFPETVVR